MIWVQRMNKRLVIIALTVLVIIIGLYFFVFKKAEPANKPALKASVNGELSAQNPPADDATISPVKPAQQRQIEEYTKAIQKSPNDPNNFYRRGILYLQDSQIRLAINDFNSALKLLPESPYILYNRALAYRLNGNFNDALNDLTAAITAKRDFADAYNTRGLTYVDLDRFDEAMVDYKKALDLNEKFSDVYFNMGTLYMRTKKYEEAKKSFEKAIATNVGPVNATDDEFAQMQRKLMQAYLNLSRAELMLQDYQAALKDATYVVTNDPKNVDALRLRAQIYEKTGNSAAAATDEAMADNLGIQNMLQQK